MISRRTEQDSPDIRPLSAFLNFRRHHHDSKALPENSNKVIFEMGAVGLMTIGLLGVSQANEVAIRPIDAKLYQSPDCEVIDLATQKIVQQVEVVHFTEYSHKEGILKFFLKTKLSPVYSYPEEVAILCHWLGVQNEINWESLHKQVIQIAPNRNFFIVVRTDYLSPKYQLAQIAPELRIHKIDLFS